MRPLLTAALLLAATAAAQDSTPKLNDKSAIKFDATTAIVAAGNYKPLTVIDAVADFMDWNIFSDKNELKMAKVITLQNAMKFDKADCEEAISELMFAAGMIFLPQNAKLGLYEVIHMQGRRAREIHSRATVKTTEQVRAKPNLKQPVRVTVKLENVNATIVTNALRPFFAQAGGAAAHRPGLVFGTAGAPDAILLVGLHPDVVKAIDLIEEVDGGGADSGDK